MGDASRRGDPRSRRGPRRAAARSPARSLGSARAGRPSRRARRNGDRAAWPRPRRDVSPIRLSEAFVILAAAPQLLDPPIGDFINEFPWAFFLVVHVALFAAG